MKPAPKLGTVYFDVRRGSYWMQIGDGDYLPLPSSSIKRQLQMAGMAVDDYQSNGLKNWECVLTHAESQRHVDYAGPLAGYQAGPVEVEGGARLLVTQGYQVTPASKECVCPWLEKFFDVLLGPEQLRYFVCWLKFARQSLAEKSFRPGQFVVLCGPSQCGKSLTQSIITLALSGRVADPWRYMTEKTPFNGDLCQAEHLAIDDKAGSFDIRTRLKFGAAIKDISASPLTSLHAKGSQAVTLRLFKRGTFSLNDEAENVMVLPPMDDHMRDKMMLFKCDRTEVEEDKIKVWKRIVRELPGFLHYVDTYPIPKALGDSRYGIKAFAHPALLEALEGFSPERRLDDLISDVVFRNDDARQFEGTSEALERKLRASDFCFAVESLLKFPTACGVYLARLRNHYPDRYTSRKVAGRTIWTIEKRPGEGLFT